MEHQTGFVAKQRLLLAVVMLALLVGTAPAQALQSCAQVYRVNRGETLSGIAQIFGTTTTYLASLNGISNPNRIFPGQLICVRVADSAPQTSQYVVQRGDWVWMIARRFGVNPFDIIRVNNLLNPNRIFPGQVLTIPALSAFAVNPVQPVTPSTSGVPLNQPQITTPPTSGGVINPPPPVATAEVTGP